MKENPLFNSDEVTLFDPVNMDDEDATPDEVADAIERTYDGFHIPLQPAIKAMFRAQTLRLASDFALDPEPDSGVWAFVQSPDMNAGFWYPLDFDTYSVEVQGNGYVNEHMPATAFGAGLTFTALNHLTWYHNDLREEKASHALSDADYRDLMDLHNNLRAFLLDLADKELIDAEAYLGFID